MNKKLVLGHVGYAAPEEYNRVGPFYSVFDSGKNLINEDSIAGVDAIVVWGGEDISTSFYDEVPLVNEHSGPFIPSKRDLAEWHLITEAKTAGIPMIGVCRGAQMMCAFAGGKLVQHCTNHGTQHWITTNDNNKRFFVSSIHHQMMYPYEVPHELLAWMEKPKSTVYLPEHTSYCTALSKSEVAEPELVLFTEINALAVQCHPEYHEYSDPFNSWFNRQIATRFFV